MGTYTGGNSNNTFIADDDGQPWLLSGKGGNDYLAGKSQNDTIYGDEGNDTLDGGAGNDILDGGIGFDSLYGGDGNDTLNDTDGIVNGGAGTNTLVADYSKLSNGAGVDLGFNGQNAIFSRLNGENPVLSFRNIERFEITGSQYADVLRGGTGNDIFSGGAGDDLLFGGAGNDTLNGGAGNDKITDTDGIVDGGAGTDTLVANYSNLSNGAGVDLGFNGQNAIFSRLNGENPVLSFRNIERFEITGSQYADVLRGGTGNDIFSGGAGDDLLFGEAGNDALNGGAGNDTLNGGDGNDRITDTDGIVDGGAGTDTLVADYSQLNNGAGVVVAYQDQNSIFSRFTENPILNYSNIERFEITGTQYADVLRGTAGNDILNGGAGNDILDGGAGNDILNGGDGDDILNGGAGNDSLNSGAGNDILNGGAGNDILNSGAGDDRITDTDGIVNGNAGTDTLVADYSQLNNGAGVEVSSLASQGQNSIFSRFTVTQLLNYSNIERFEITGTQYADVLRGGAGNDILNGGAGDDVLIGSPGNDILTGGTGADQFVFNSKLEGLDVIKDFSRVEGDKIQISKIGFGITDFSSFSYNDATGALLFQGTQFATLENKPANFAVSLDIQLI